MAVKTSSAAVSAGRMLCATIPRAATIASHAIMNPPAKRNPDRDAPESFAARARFAYGGIKTSPKANEVAIPTICQPVMLASAFWLKEVAVAEISARDDGD